MRPRPLTLIQLVSEQTMQNLLPVLRLRPERLVHLATPRTANRSVWIGEAARQSQCPVALETVTLSGMPGMRETMQATLTAIEHAAEADHEVLLNFTGGTKLMGIGAYVAALKHKTPSVYVDTQEGAFVDGHSGVGVGTAFQDDLSFTPILRSLSVNTIAVAHGCGRVTDGLDWQPWLALSRHLASHPADEEACHAAIHGVPGQRPVFTMPRRAGEWLAALDTDLEVPAAVAILAVTSGHYRPGSRSNTLRLPDAGRGEFEELARLDGQGSVPGYIHRLFRAAAPLQTALNFLGGAWWEVLVAERMRESGRFRDLRWSVQIGERGGADLEEDLVALEGVRVAYVSCKRSSQGGKLLPQLEQIHARAAKLGGTFNRRFLAVYQRPRFAVLRNLEKRAHELGIRLVFGDDLGAADPFG